MPAPTALWCHNCGTVLAPGSAKRVPWTAEEWAWLLLAGAAEDEAGGQDVCPVCGDSWDFGVLERDDEIMVGRVVGEVVW